MEFKECQMAIDLDNDNKPFKTAKWHTIFVNFSSVTALRESITDCVNSIVLDGYEKSIGTRCRLIEIFNYKSKRKPWVLDTTHKCLRTFQDKVVKVGVTYGKKHLSVLYFMSCV